MLQKRMEEREREREREKGVGGGGGEENTVEYMFALKIVVNVIWLKYTISRHNAICDPGCLGIP